MKIGFYNPYFDAYGGGERYVLTLASHWSEKHNVSVFWGDNKMLEKSSVRFGLDLSRIRLADQVFCRGIIRKIIDTSGYDLIFVLSDGSIPITGARKNILHLQMPFPTISQAGFNLSFYSRIVCNSAFTRNHLGGRIRNKSVVIYPPVETGLFKPDIKEKIILSVGRFSSHHMAKKQDIMIDAFRNILPKLPRGWKFILAGSLHPEDETYFEYLKEKAGGMPVEFFPNSKFEELKNLYGISAVYWHAAGYGETEPVSMEHFGISTVESMSAGCVPIVFPGGGQSEIITEGRDGLFWKQPDDLAGITLRLIADRNLMHKISQYAVSKSGNFSTARFKSEYDKLLSNL